MERGDLLALTDREGDDHGSVQVAAGLTRLTGVEGYGNKGAQDNSLDLLATADEQVPQATGDDGHQDVVHLRLDLYARSA